MKVERKVRSLNEGICEEKIQANSLSLSNVK